MVGDDGITVNVVAPGLTVTPKVREVIPAELISRQVQQRSIKREEAPEDLVGTVILPGVARCGLPHGPDHHCRRRQTHALTRPAAKPSTLKGIWANRRWGALTNVDRNVSNMAAIRYPVGQQEDHGSRMAAAGAVGTAGCGHVIEAAAG